jgi:hypothetical protein
MVRSGQRVRRAYRPTAAEKWREASRQFSDSGAGENCRKIAPLCSGEVIEGKAQITQGVLTVELRERLAASIMAYCVERDPSHGIPF